MLTPRSSAPSLALASLLAAFALACGNSKGEGVGTISLPLQATAASGNVYQLRNATFQVTGPTSITLTTAGMPDSSPALIATLQSGSYSAQLLAGWSLVRIDATGGAQPVQAQLVSANPATFTVAGQQQTTVGFAFDALGDIVDTSQGTARIVVTVNERDAGADGGSDAGPACRAINEQCGLGRDCCSNVCVNGRCTDGVCSGLDGPCGRSGGTCCVGGFCALNGGPTGDTCLACRALTQTCTANEQCCSNSCVAGRCTDGSCSQVNGPCGRSGGTCCAGAFCALNGGPTGDTCLACRQTDQTCSANEQCCGGSCVAGRCAPATLAVPTFIGAGAGAEGTGDLTVPYPTGITAGQLLILQVGSRSSNVPVTPAGWTLLLFDEHGNARQRLYYKVAAASDTGTLAVAAGASNVNGARMYAFSGVVPVSSFSEGAATSFDDDGTLAGPTVVATGSGRLAVAFVVLDSNPLMAPFIGETGGDWNEAVPEFLSAIGSNLGLQLQTAPLPSGGVISGGEANFGGASDSSICRAFALIGM